MPTRNLTAKTLESLKSVSTRTDYWDASLPGFGVRVSPDGRKAFCVMFRYGGRKRRLTIGTHPPLTLAQARDLAREALSQVAHDSDPATDKQESRKGYTFSTLATEYLVRHARAKKRSWKTDEWYITRKLVPAYGQKLAKDIKRPDVRMMLDELAVSTPILANRVLACLRKIYNWGISQDLVEHNPCLGIERPSPEVQRDRVLTEDEIRKIWKALDEEQPMMAATFRLRLLTAQRGSEVHSMRWSEIDGNWWTIPAEVAKNGLSHRVPLSPQAMRVLDQLRKISGDYEWVFPNRKRTGHVYECQKLAQRVRRKSGVEYRAHDLRRTAASLMTGMGIPRLVVSKILNHVESGVTKVYDRHSYDREKRDAIDRWGARMARIVSGLQEVSKERA